MRKKTKEKSGAVALRGRKNSLKEPLRCCAIETPSIETCRQNLYFQSRSSFFLFDWKIRGVYFSYFHNFFFPLTSHLILLLILRLCNRNTLYRDLYFQSRSSFFLFDWNTRAIFFYIFSKKWILCKCFWEKLMSNYKKIFLSEAI